MKPAPTAKNQLLHTAARLFYEHGYRAIGVDTIAAESGIGKMTLYRHFASKDDLIVAFLRYSNDVFWEIFEHSTRAAATPRGQLLAFFEALQAQVTSPVSHGCPFLNLSTEYPETHYAGHQVALENKQAVRARFAQLAQAAGAQAPEVLADALLLLMDGAYMSARMFGGAPHIPGASVAAAARCLIEAQCAA